jgi:hypothetical protein
MDIFSNEKNFITSAVIKNLEGENGNFSFNILIAQKETNGHQINWQTQKNFSDFESLQRVLKRNPFPDNLQHSNLTFLNNFLSELISLKPQPKELG